jgi:hypothetical protein
MLPSEMLRQEDAAATNPTRNMAKPLTSFSIKNLSVLAYANGFTLWHYKAKTITNLLSSNFFAECGDMLAIGDHMHVSAPDGAALLHIESAAKDLVTVRKMLA